MHPSRIAVALSALISIASAGVSDPVLLASRRGGWIEAFDLETLKTVSRIRVPEMTETVASDPQGRRLFLTAPMDHPKGCCALFALDPQSLQLSLLVKPSLSATITPTGVFTQRGNVGIEMFDLLSLKRLPTSHAPGVYRFEASSDGSRLFGLSNFPHPSLDLFDAVQGSLIASQSLPGGSKSAGAWIDQQFFLFTLQSGQAMLRPISPNGQTSPVVPLSVSSSFPDCVEAPYGMIAFAGKLILYPSFGGKEDSNCQGHGGFAIADPGTGLVLDRFDSSRFRQIVASPDGRYLYGLEVGMPAWRRRVQILKVDATGRVIGQRDLDPDVWYLIAGGFRNSWWDKWIWWHCPPSRELMHATRFTDRSCSGGILIHYRSLSRQ